MNLWWDLREQLAASCLLQQIKKGSCSISASQTNWVKYCPICCTNALPITCSLSKVIPANCYKTLEIHHTKELLIGGGVEKCSKLLGLQVFMKILVYLWMLKVPKCFCLTAWKGSTAPSINWKNSKNKVWRGTSQINLKRQQRYASFQSKFLHKLLQSFFWFLALQFNTTARSKKHKTA